MKLHPEHKHMDVQDLELSVPGPWIPSDDEATTIMGAVSKLSKIKELNIKNLIALRLAFLGFIRIHEMVQINVNVLMEDC